MSYWNRITFLHPYLLWGIPLAIVLFAIWFYYKKNKQFAALETANNHFWPIQKTWQTTALKCLPFIRLAAIIFIIMALARPQSKSSNQKINTYGVDIIISIDISASMLAKDFDPNRLEAAKKVASNFILNRPNDRIGLVIFAGESFTQVPITTDHKIVLSQLEKIEYGMLQDGTAIGMGIGTAINRLKDSKAKSKVTILMTDGVNNSGLIDPVTASEAAVQYKVKVYTIGVGSKGTAYQPAYLLPDGSIKYDNLPVEIDEQLLNNIAKMTGGKYYRATSNNSLQKIYNEIDKLERTEIESSQSIQYTEEFYPLVAIAIILLFIEQLLFYGFIKIFP